MKIHVYVLEVISYCDPISIRRKFRRKYRTDSEIRPAILSTQLRHARNPTKFIEEMRRFAAWQQSLTLQHDEIILFWLSAHGMERGGGPWFPQDTHMDNLGVFKDVDGILQKQTVILYSACWGALPQITRIMHDRDGHGPILLFGPTLAVVVEVLDYAEEMTLKLLASAAGQLTEQALIEHIDAINLWGSRKFKDHRDFWRVWYWGTHRRQPKRYPVALPQYAEPSAHT